MLIKKILPLLLVGLVALLVGCFNDGEPESTAQADQMEFRSDQPPGPTTEECEASLPKPCSNCKIRIVDIDNAFAQWSITSYGAGANEHRCCVNGSWTSNVSIGGGCGTGDTQLGVWHDLACGLNIGSHMGLIFRSNNCSGGNCQYTPNSVLVQMTCGNNVTSFYMDANQDGDCSDQNIDTAIIGVQNGCYLTSS